MQTLIRIGVQLYHILVIAVASSLTIVVCKEHQKARCSKQHLELVHFHHVATPHRLLYDSNSPQQ